MEWSGGCQTPRTRFLVEWRTKASNMRTISISLNMGIAEQSSHSFPGSNNNYYVIAKRGRAPYFVTLPPPDGIDFVLGIRYSLPAVGFLSTYRSLWRVFWHSFLCYLIQCWYWNYPLIAHIHLMLVCSDMEELCSGGWLTVSVPVWWTYSQLNTQTAFTTGLGTGTLSRLGMPI